MKIKVTYSAVFNLVLLVFLLSTATGIGPYSTKFGPQWSLVLLVCTGLMAFMRPKEVAAVTLRRGPLLGFLFFFLLFVAALATDEGRQLNLVKSMFVQIFCYLLALWLASRFIGTPQFRYAVGAAFIVAAGANIYEFFVAPETWSISEGRAAGFFVNPNTSGAEIALLAILVLVSDTQISWLRISAVLLTGFLAILVTFSRGATLVFIISVVIYYLMRAREKRRLNASTLFAISASVPIVVWLVGKMMQAPLSNAARLRLNSMIARDFSDRSTESRTSSLFEYVRLFMDHPFFGSKPFGSLLETDGMGPHNSFIALGADFGVLAMLAPLAIIFIALLTARAAAWRGPKAMTLLVICVWLFTVSMFSHNIFYSPYGAIAAGLAMGGVAGGLGRRSPSGKIVRG